MVHIQALKNLENVKHLAVNIGRCAVSVAAITSFKYNNILDEESLVTSGEKDRLQVIFFRKTDVNLLLHKIRHLLKANSISKTSLFIKQNNNSYEKFKQYFNFKVAQHNKAAVKGIHFLLQNVRDEAYVLKNVDTDLQFINDIKTLYPYILVEMNNEISYVKVTSNVKYESLVDSSSDTDSCVNFSNYLDETNDFEHTIKLAKLFSITSSHDNDSRINSNKADSTMNELKAAYSMVKSFCNKIGRMCTFFAKENRISNIMIEGSITDDIFFKQMLTKSIKNSIESCIDVIFLRHENFVNGLGSMLLCSPYHGIQKSWFENYSESTGMMFEFCFFEGIETQQLTLDSLEDIHVMSPLLLCPQTYSPDTQNLVEDTEAREYWIKCIQDGITSGINKAITTSNSKASNGLRSYRDMVIEKLDYLNCNPQAFGDLCMRILQDTLEHMKRENGLIKMYEQKKVTENELALKELKDRLKYIDSLGQTEKQQELIISMLAGNMFDLGAREITRLINEGKFGFLEAMAKLPERPWLVDDLDKWVKRSCGPPHTCAMVFCDNSGYDFILGVIPFVRDLLQRGTKVIICVNRDPVINDMTYYGLQDLLTKIQEMCPIIEDCLKNGNLTMAEISKSTCCLDFRSIDANIAQKMTEVDLLVIEGMGRAIHTNLHAVFNCESLLVGVVKDKWFSRKLGGDLFSCICKHSM